MTWPKLPRSVTISSVVVVYRAVNLLPFPWKAAFKKERSNRWAIFQDWPKTQDVGIIEDTLDNLFLFLWHPLVQKMDIQKNV